MPVTLHRQYDPRTEVEVEMVERTEFESDQGRKFRTRILAREEAPQVAWRRLVMVNVAFIGAGNDEGNWALVDAGVPGSAGAIRETVEERFSDAVPPRCVILTHGHFDHVGALETLLPEWNVPVFAHRREFPYLDGSTSYPASDPSVGGGLLSLFSRFYPRGPINISRWLQPLPDDGTVPGFPEWRWIHTPGHTPGHISLWRSRDRVLIAGDAVITTRQESAYAVFTQREELHGPPMYFTTDWISARQSVATLAALSPEILITGHGPAMRGEKMREDLQELVRNFDYLGMPRSGRYLPPENSQPYSELRE